MKSVLNEIITLRGGKIPVIDSRNSNRYRIVTSENNGTKTAYCFGMPIYNRRTRKLVELRFHEKNGILKAYGSNAEITIGNGVSLKNKDGFCKVSLPGEVTYTDETSIQYGMAKVSPTLNGILIEVPCIAERSYEMKIFSSQPFMKVQANDRCFSLMREEIKPLVTVSCIGVLDSEGQLISPCRLDYHKNSDQEYALSLRHISPYSNTLLFEINLHEDKLFQDTTVESLHPKLNNAFGGTAFIGNTAAYGEQWLYSRLDFSRLSELYDKRIQKAILHLPRLGGNCSLSAFELTAQFCSFRSNWDNKIQAAEELTDAYTSSKYQSLDITNLATDCTHFLRLSEGFILKPKSKGNGFSTISTGDSYFAPQILKINYQ